MEVVEKEAEGDLQALRSFVAKEAREIENELERDLRSFGRGFTVIEKVLLSLSLSVCALPPPCTSSPLCNLSTFMPRVHLK